MTAADRWTRMHTLRHPGHHVDLTTGEALFRYVLEGPDSSLPFTETITFPLPERLPDRAALDAFHRILDLLHIAAGVSYYKLAAPRSVVFEATPLADKALPWATALYQQGMAEYAYRNDLPHVLDLEPVAAAGTAADPAGLDRTGAPPLVPVGGGKDSIVTVEALRLGGFGPVLFAVNPNRIISSVLDVAGLPARTARRRLDPTLLEFNRTGAYNGHVPVTAINSLTAVATALLHGLGPVVMSNESSASVPNLSWHGRDVNHQWSKGIDAESRLRDALAAHAGLTDGYFSLLRGLSELHIARLASRFDAYDAVMTSCNAAFKLTNASERWCGDCPKCRFVFLALAPFAGRRRITAVVGRDVLDDPTQLPGYRELTGLAAHKPFECVGETEESLVAVRLLAEDPEWADATVVRALRAEIPAALWPADDAVAAAFAGAGPHLVPPAYARALTDLA